MTAEEGRERVLAVMLEVIAAGVKISGHWDDDTVCLFFEPGGRKSSAEITVQDLGCWE